MNKKKTFGRGTEIIGHEKRFSDNNNPAILTRIERARKNAANIKRIHKEHMLPGDSLSKHYDMSTQKERKDTLRMILWSVGRDGKIPNWLFPTVEEVFASHPFIVGNKNVRMHKFVKFNHQQDDRCFCAVVDEKKLVDLSMDNAIAPHKVLNRRIRQACRNGIAEQMREMKGGDDSMHVHHDGEQFFQIMRDFVGELGTIKLLANIFEDTHGRDQFKPKMLKKWRKFHDARFKGKVMTPEAHMEHHREERKNNKNEK